MTLEELRNKAFFQNTIDVWLMLCSEKNWESFDSKRYQSFIDYLKQNEVKMQKFPLCIKESGGVYERGRDKTKFLEELSKISEDNAAAYTIKLSETIIKKIRSFA